MKIGIRTKLHGGVDAQGYQVKQQGGGEEFTRFFDLFDETVERHRFVGVLENDVEGRREIKDEIVMLVVPSFHQRFTQKQKDKECSKNPQKYIKRTAEDVEAQLRSLFAR